MSFRSDKMEEIQDLAKGFLCLKEEKEMLKFLRDLCTISELEEMALRFRVAKMLDEKKSIREIAEETELSTTTVSRVSQWKKSLGAGGYDLVLSRLKLK
jgi:TrpR-related protein YerC/YecD